MNKAFYKIYTLIFFIGLLSIQSAHAESDVHCEQDRKLKPYQILVGFTYINKRLYPAIKDPVLSPLLIIENKSFTTVNGNMLSRGMTLTLPLMPDKKYVKIKNAGSYVEHIGPDYCVYYGEFAENGQPEWTIVSTKDINSLRSPSLLQTKHFYQINTQCLRQGDYEKGKEPPCVKPQLIAVSDINQNNSLEYWYTEPYTWDTGFTVAEETESNDLNVLVKACPSCD